MGVYNVIQHNTNIFCVGKFICLHPRPSSRPEATPHNEVLFGTVLTVTIVSTRVFSVYLCDYHA